jgi:hypothetical protein
MANITSKFEGLSQMKKSKQLRLNLKFKNRNLRFLVDYMADKTKEECIAFWEELKKKLENNTYQPSRSTFSFAESYSYEERIKYCDRMIEKLNKD